MNTLVIRGLESRMQRCFKHLESAGFPRDDVVGVSCLALACARHMICEDCAPRRLGLPTRASLGAVPRDGQRTGHRLPGSRTAARAWPVGGVTDNLPAGTSSLGYRYLGLYRDTYPRVNDNSASLRLAERDAKIRIFFRLPRFSTSERERVRRTREMPLLVMGWVPGDGDGGAGWK